MKLKTIQKNVKDTLEVFPETRASDKLLYYRLLQKVSPDTLSMAVGSYLVDRHVKVPSIESVGRARRKIQELYPHLRPNKVVQEHRAQKEQEYREYAGR